MLRSVIELVIVYAMLIVVLLFPELKVSPKPDQWTPTSVKMTSKSTSPEQLTAKTTQLSGLLQPKPDGTKRELTAPPLALCLPIKVTEVHDGDTAKVSVTFDLTVRYANCWAPELKQPDGPKSADRAKEAVGKAGRLFVDLSNVRNLADALTFGRVIGEIWLDGQQESESAKQVRLKMASTRKGGKLGE
jgi:endonuclease YncB( thermonuclease family)